MNYFFRSKKSLILNYKINIIIYDHITIKRTGVESDALIH